jgi:hypothetical protein
VKVPDFIWRDYEDHIYTKLSEWAGPRAAVKFDQTLPGKFSEVERQVDVVVKGDSQMSRAGR